VLFWRPGARVQRGVPLYPKGFPRRQPKMKSHTSFKIATVLMASACVILSATTGSADQNALRAQAQAELARVTVDVDKANIRYSPADDDVGYNFSKVEEYQQEYLAGRQSFQDGKYS
jgi:hypothetical protein